MGDGYEAGIQSAEWQNDMARHTALLRMKNNGSHLQLLNEDYRADPDIVLAAVSSYCDALEFADQRLLRNRDWVLEAIHRNWRVLECLPQAFRVDTSVVLAAARENLEALDLAEEPLRSDADFRAQASTHGLADSMAYEGECLRLVGDFNRWYTTDAATRMTKLRRASTKSGAVLEDTGSVVTPAPGATRHMLVVHLLDGWVTFQVVSCMREFNFRIFPAEDDAAAVDPFKLEAGDPCAVRATVGGQDDGHGADFYISERNSSTVCIYVELREGNCSGSRSVLVWYEVERKPSRWPGLILLRQRGALCGDAVRPRRVTTLEATPEPVPDPEEVEVSVDSLPLQAGEPLGHEDGRPPARRERSTQPPEQGSVHVHGAGGVDCTVTVDLADDVRGLKQQLTTCVGIADLAQRLILDSVELHEQELLSALVPVGGCVDVELAQRRGDVVEWLSRLREDRTKKAKTVCLTTAPQELLADADFMFPAVQQHERALQFAAPALKADRQVVLAAVQLAGQALKFAGQELRSDYEVVLAAVRRDGWALEYAAPALQADRTLVLAAVQQDGWALQFASSEVQADREVALAAVESEGWAISSVAPELQSDREVALVAVRQDWEVLEDIAEELRADRAFMLAVVREAGQALRFAPPELLADREIALAAVGQDGTAISLVASEVQDFDLAVVAARQDPRALQLLDQKLASRVAKSLGKRLLPADPVPRKPHAVPEELRKLRKHFRTLGLDEDCSVDEIRKRYRQLALENHPDKHPEDVEAAKQKFQQISYAYQALKEHFGL